MSQTAGVDRLTYDGKQPVVYLIAYLHPIVDFRACLTVLWEVREVLFERRVQTSDEQEILDDVRRFENLFEKVDSQARSLSSSTVMSAKYSSA